MERVDDKLLKLDLKFREPHVEFEELTLVGSGGGRIRVDDFNLARDFGVTVTAVKGDLKVPKRIEVSTTAPYLNTAFRENPVLSLECVMRAGNLKEVGARIDVYKRQVICLMKRWIRNIQMHCCITISIRLPIRE